IITHPERNPIVRKNLSRVLEWVEQGCLVQITANSMTGRWGQEAQEAAEWLMKRHAVHVLASDAHGIGSRPPILSAARTAAERIVGKDAAAAPLERNPAAIVADRTLQPV